MSVQRIIEAVQSGYMSSEEGAHLLELRRELEWRRRHPVLAWLKRLLARKERGE